ncbi:MAG TPA: multifunctional CCA addition/repair protein [Leucothrix mucor]|nr:multifunctional CCA addition/repair protein [Leucothrix mucor]
MKTYLVGGAVRDKLLGLAVKDNDWVVTGATPDEMLEKGFTPVGKDFPVFLHPKTHEEYALARTERKTAAGYHGFQFHADSNVTLEDDVQRRDLTINALAEDENGNILDYVNGQADLDKRLLRHVSPAFAEDPVRILRIARFAARFAPLGFKVAKSTMTLMRDMVKQGEVDALVAERVWQEMERALGEPSPDVFIEVLRECGALKVLFPEIDRLFGVPQPEEHHPEIDTGIHTLMVLQQSCLLSNDPVVRFAALTHDLGKGTTPKEILPHHYNHEERGYDLVKELCERYKIPNQYRQLAEITARYHTHCHRAFEIKPKTLLKTLNATDAFRKPERFEQFLLACTADSHGRPGYEDYDYKQAPFFSLMRKKAAEIDVQEIIKDGFEREKITEELYQRRLILIKHERKQVSDD